jgi:hypothetical protein
MSGDLHNFFDITRKGYYRLQAEFTLPDGPTGVTKKEIFYIYAD